MDTFIVIIVATAVVLVLAELLREVFAGPSRPPAAFSLRGPGLPLARRLELTST